MDAYRLSPEESDTIGFAAAIANPHHLVLVEWPENLPTAAKFPTDARIITLRPSTSTPAGF